MLATHPQLAQCRRIDITCRAGTDTVEHCGLIDTFMSGVEHHLPPRWWPPEARSPSALQNTTPASIYIDNRNISSQ